MTIVKPNSTFYQNRNNTQLFDRWKNQDWTVVETWPQINIIRISPVNQPDLWVDVGPQEVDEVIT